jgi:hypothetical protein
MSKFSTREKREKLKMVWVWTENKQVSLHLLREAGALFFSIQRTDNSLMIGSVSTLLSKYLTIPFFVCGLDFLFYFFLEAIAALQPLFLEGSQVTDEQNKRVAIFPKDLQNGLDFLFYFFP